MSKKSPTFEEALGRLEQIADEIEQGKVGLEDSIVRYEEGMRLIQQCREILVLAEQRIVKLQTESAAAPGVLTPDAAAEKVPPGN